MNPQTPAEKRRKSRGIQGTIGREGAGFAPLGGTDARLIFASTRAARHAARSPVEPALGMRTRGSARFGPYFKVLWWDTRTCAWIDVQKAHATVEAARAACRPGVKYRVMEITERGRLPLSEET